MRSIFFLFTLLLSSFQFAAESQPYENMQIEKIEISIGGEQNKTQEASTFQHSGIRSLEFT